MIPDFSVTYVPQGSYNICWAASTACIVNSVKGTNYTALEVATERRILIKACILRSLQHLWIVNMVCGIPA